MEVTPEVFAWLTEHKIINPEKSLIMRKDLVLIDESITSRLINGFHIDKILYELENLYNKFYKIKLIYTQKLEEIKPHQQNLKNINLDKTVRTYIWKIIGQVIENFGIEVSEEKINLISNGDKDTLKNLLKTIFTLTNELKKRAVVEKSSDNNNKNENEKSFISKSPEKNLKENGKLKSLNQKNLNADNNNNNINSTLLKNRKNNNSISLTRSNNTLTDSIETGKKLNNDLSNKNSSLIQKSFLSNNLINESGFKPTFHVKKASDALDLNNLNANKKLEEAESPLEFYILTLARSLDMKPRQAVALLSNNRKYLIQIANRGIKGDYTKITNWYQEVIYNYSVLMNIIKFSNMKDLKPMTFATLSVGLFSKNLQVAQNAYGLLIQLEADIGSDFDWLIKEGLESFIFCINKHRELRTGLLNLVYKMGGKDSETLNKEFFDTKKFTNAKIFEFISNIIDIVKLSGFSVFNYFKSAIPEFCFKENTEKATAIALLADCWIILELNSDADAAVISNIIKFYKNSLREKGQRNIQFVTINQFFRLLSKLMVTQDPNTSVIYKTLVFHFLENYDDKNLREIFLHNFTSLFEKESNLPLEVLLDPYLRQIKNSSNYEVIDFSFLKKIIDNTKINKGIINEILEFSFYVSLTNMFYSRSANNLINQILEKHLINEKYSSSSKILEDIVKYIKNALKIFMQNPKDYMILESAYDILNFDFEYINKNVELEVIETVENFRREKGNYSMGLLALLWFYEVHDDVLLRFEEKYTDKVDKYYIELKAKKKNELEKKKSLKVIPRTFKPADVIKLIKEKREKEEKLKEEIKLQQISQQKKLIKNLSRKVLDKSADAAKSILETNANNYTQIYSHLNNLTAIENNISALNNNLSLLNNLTLLNPIAEANNENNKSLIPNRNNSLGDISKIFNSGAVQKKDPLAYLKNFPYFINLEECESRELVAIEGLFREFGKVIKQIFHNFSTDGNNTISRTNLLKLTREIGIENDLLSLDELSSLIRLTFGVPVNNLERSQFDKLLIQLANLIFSKIKPNIPVSRCLQEFLFYLENSLNKDKSNISRHTFDSTIHANSYNYDRQENRASNKTANKTLNYLKRKIENILVSEEDMIYYFSPKDLSVTKTENLKTDSEMKLNRNDKNPFNETDSTLPYYREVLMPPGYKKRLTTKVEYDYKLNKDFALSFLSESQIICYEIIDEILKNKFKKSSIEPYVKVFNYFKVIEEPLNPKKKWCDAIAIHYAKMDKPNEADGKEVGDLLEEMLRAIDKGWSGLEKPKILGPKDKENLELKIKITKENEERDKKLLERKREISQQLAKLNEDKLNEKKSKEEEMRRIKENKEKEIQLQIQREKEAREKLKKDVQKAKEIKEKMKEEKLRLEKQKADEALKKKEQEKLDFFKKQKRKLKEQFKEIKSEKNNFLKQQQELLNVKLPEVNIKKILEKDKEYVEFEKNLNDRIGEILNRMDIKEFFANYEPHFKTIYDIYSKIGSNKITFFYEDAIHFNEFKEFCVNFMILGLLINTEQMTFIFRKVSKINEGTSEDTFFLKFPDFLISIIYISIFLKITNRPNRRILPGDLEKIDTSSLKALMDFIGLKLPFNKKELEDFINDRRALSAKQMHKLHTQIKRERTDLVKPSSANRVRSSLLRNRKSLGKTQLDRDRGDEANKNEEERENLINSAAGAGNIKVVKPIVSSTDENDDRWQVVKRK